MGNKLNPGNMHNAAGATQAPSDFTSTMASAMEKALLRLFEQDSMNTFAIETNSSDARDRRRILIAIAQGVVSHLVENAAAFKVTGTDSVGKPITASLSIDAGTTLLSDLGRWP